MAGLALLGRDRSRVERRPVDKLSTFSGLRFPLFGGISASFLAGQPSPFGAVQEANFPCQKKLDFWFATAILASHKC